MGCNLHLRKNGKKGGYFLKDLKHLIFFEDLLQEANNKLVRQAKDDGKLALGYTCYFMPEVLLDLPGCFSVRLRAPRCTSPDIATYYLSAIFTMDNGFFKDFRTADFLAGKRVVFFADSYKWLFTD